MLNGLVRDLWCPHPGTSGNASAFQHSRWEHWRDAAQADHCREEAPGYLAGVLALSLSYGLLAIFARFGRCLVELRQVLASADRVLVPKAPAPRHCTSKVDARSLVTFVDVSCVNPRTGTALLNRFSESFRSGEVVVIMGPSGIGKSTFANLVVGAVRPAWGQVNTLGRADGYVSSDHAVDVQLLTSEPVFRPGPLREHYAGADLAELDIQAEFLHASAIVRTLPAGFAESVPHNGVLQLSKSEQQRLALLDLVANPPRVAIFDEAASELEAQEEVRLVRAIVSALPKTLFFIITHNPGLLDVATRHFYFDECCRLVEASVMSATDIREKEMGSR
ncbi:ATP-binding cassette domain-containing protein [Mycolicibacterium boenickei]